MGFFSRIFNFFRPVVRNFQTSASLTSLLLGKRLNKIEEIPTRKESPFLNRYLDSPLRSTVDTSVKKTMAVAVAIAKKRGIATPVAAKTPMELASTVDEGITRMKVAYQYGKGRLSSTKAAEEFIDRTAARVVAFTDKVIEKGVPIVADAVVNAVTKVFPPAKVIAPVVKAAVPFVTKAIKTVVRKGVEVIANVAKTVVKVVSGVKKIGKKIWNFLFG